MARKYTRDNRGRFASTGSTGRVTGGTLAARKSLSRSRQKAAGNAVQEQYSGKGSLSQQLSSRAQKAAVTRGSNRLKRAQSDNTTRVKGGMAGVVRPSKRGKPEAPKQSAPQKTKNRTKPIRRVDEAKVERILGRLNAGASRPTNFDRKGTVKLENAQQTRIRAMTYLVKAAGGKNVKVRGGTVRADYGNQTRDQMISQAAAKLSKPTRRSTLKSGSNVVAERQKIRKAAAQSSADSRSGKGVYGMHGRTVASGRRPTLQAVPKGPQAQPEYAGSLRIYTPKPQPQSYTFERIKRRSKGSMKAQELSADGKSFLDRSTVTFSGRKTFRTRSQAAAAQSSRRRGVGRLAGTARLGNPPISGGT